MLLAVEYFYNCTIISCSQMVLIIYIEMSNEFYPFAFGHNCITKLTKRSGNVLSEFLLQAKQNHKCITGTYVTSSQSLVTSEDNVIQL